jgi:glycosyltransferase involved in cell wall biosynthesis
MLSIIIPSLNEERFIGRVLESIKNQNLKDYEIIVADAGSKDQTIKIAKKYGCRIVKGGLPARGRNNGAKAARGNLLLFIDADCFVPKNCLKMSLEEYEKRRLDISTFMLLPDNKSGIRTICMNLLYNYPILMLEKILPHGAMGILVDRNVFNRLNGFDETIKLAEDHDLIRRAAKIGRFGIIRVCKILISYRRFETDGWLKTYAKFLLCELHMIFLGPVRSDIFRYKFNHYRKK